MVAYIAVDIAPASIVTPDEAAQFVQPVRPPTRLEPRDEFDFRMNAIGRGAEAFDLQTQPAGRVGGVFARPGSRSAGQVWGAQVALR